MNLTITPSAEKFMLRMVRFNGGGESSGFRLTVTAGGCSGLSSEFTVEAAPLSGDSVVESNGLKIFLPAESRVLLEGVTIDFLDSAMSSGLKFINPNAASCGSCGSSGSAASASIDVSSIGHNH
jgi:iron-sulfur cluster assembly protein